MEDEKKELKDVLIEIQNDYGNLGIGIEFLEEEINEEECSVEKLKKCAEDVEVWVSNLQSVIDDLDEARIIFQKKQIINNLNTQ